MRDVFIITLALKLERKGQKQLQIEDNYNVVAVINAIKSQLETNEKGANAVKWIQHNLNLLRSKTCLFLKKEQFVTF